MRTGTRPGLTGWWRRVLQGDRPWGSVDVRADRFGVMRYRLTVYPPGIDDRERRQVRLARGWPLWGAVLWIICEIWLSRLTGPWVSLAMSTVVYFGAGFVAVTMAGEPRKRVKTMVAVVMAGYADPDATAARDKLTQLASALIEADERRARGEMSPSAHEMIWWHVYNQMDSGRSAAAA